MDRLERPKISSGTIARTIILALALVNQILTTTGHSIIPIEDSDIQSLVSLIATAAASLVAWWKNNSFTKAALIGDEAMEDYRLNESLTAAMDDFDDLDNFDK